MAEVLIKVAQTGTGPMAWKRGDPVVVRPDGHGWGRMERDPTIFSIVRILGASVEDMEWALEPERSEDGVLDEDGNPLVVGGRRYWAERGFLPETILRELEEVGFLEVQWEDVRPVVFDRVTGESQSGRDL